MSAFVEIAGKDVRAGLSAHECGKEMICFCPFRIDTPSKEAVKQLISKAKSLLKPLQVVRICLEAGQDDIQSILEELGFGLDGIEFWMNTNEIRAEVGADRLTLPAGLIVRAMEFETDIDELVALEKVIHANEPSSRVDFDTEEAIDGMIEYYKKSCHGDGAFVLVDQTGKILGIVAFMPDSHRTESIHVSSVGLLGEVQNKGLFIPLLFTALEMSKFKNAESLTGTTTTDRLIEAAERYPVRTIGMSYSHLDCSV